jgi:hypothetical protein
MAIFSSVKATANVTNVRIVHKDPSYGGEYTSYYAYQQGQGSAAIPLKNWEGQDYYWLRTDREQQNHRWRHVCHLITSTQKQFYLFPFHQINSYYRLIYYWLAGKKHQSQWVKGAYYLVNDLTDAYYKGITSGSWFTSTDAYQLLTDLNSNICNYAITKFYDLLYGTLTKPPLTGNAAWVWDRDFIIHEQGVVALSVYQGTTDDARNLINKIFNDQGFLSWLTNPSFNGFVSFLHGLDLSGIYIPVFPNLYDSDITSPPNYGQQGRINVPLGMLYPNHFFYNDTDTNLSKPFGTALKNGESIYKTQGEQSSSSSTTFADDLSVYFAYFKANSFINSLFDL